MIKSESIVKISPALLQAQKVMGNASKDAKNPFFKSKFADLNSVREAVTGPLHDAGITILQPTVFESGRSFVRTTLLHESGEFISSDLEIVCAKQNDPQAFGSALSYARRYGLSSMLSVGAEDSDAEGAMNRTTTKSETKHANASSKIPLTAAEEIAASPKSKAPLGFGENKVVAEESGEDPVHGGMKAVVSKPNGSFSSFRKSTNV